MSELLTSFQCPNCGSLLPLDGSAANHACGACNTQFEVNGYLCPHCHQHHDTMTPSCTRCGGAMTRLCRCCWIHNPLIDEYCRSCGNALDLVDVGVADQRWRTAKLRESVVRESASFRERSEVTIQQIRNSANEFEHTQNQRMQQELDAELMRAKTLRKRMSLCLLLMAALVLIGSLFS